MENIDEAFNNNNYYLILILFIIFIVVIYIILGIVLNKLHNKIYGKGSFLAFVPVADIYLLGKLTGGRLLGILLLVIPFLNGSYEFKNGSNTFILVIMPDNVRLYLYIGYIIILVGLIVYAIIKINKLGKDETGYINEVYLNQKTEQEIEDEYVPLVKWDDNDTSNNNQEILYQTNDVIEEETLKEEDETYTYDNDKIQEAIDKIIFKDN